MDIDTGTPYPARVYDFLLGGRANYEADRRAAARLVAASPVVAEIPRVNRAFLRRATRFVVERGIRQIIDIGAGIPTSPSVHEVAHAIDPEVSVVYVDNDPIAGVHANAALARTPGTAFVEGDVRNPAAILSHPKVRELIDFDRPVALFLVLMMHFVPDADDPAGLVATLCDAVVDGSHLVLSHPTVDTEAKAKDEQLRKVWQGSSVRLSMRRPDEIAALFAGFRLVEPGLVNVRRWRPDTDGPDHGPTPHVNVVGGVGVKSA